MARRATPEENIEDGYFKRPLLAKTCIADALHYVWTAVEYATHVERHRNCTDCKCTPFFQQKKNERSWVFFCRISAKPREFGCEFVVTCSSRNSTLTCSP
ncbi:hypothetical protein NECAME_11775 [Necator americanus]|uniref:Uncharacterized protein n=1 Tax=Necator americanus TaxID=51031 RepID=W2T409_NECAM|nr:hypothetical protein NECAME_11775 [Necator americanus]ETN76269.1 hypothetical protein NECAME_11775 [Necator americanus]